MRKVSLKSFAYICILAIAQLNLKLTYHWLTTKIALYRNLWVILYELIFHWIINRLIGAQRYSIFSFMCMFGGGSLFVLLHFFFWPLWFLFFFYLRMLITPVVSSNSSLVKSILLMTGISLTIINNDSRMSNWTRSVYECWKRGGNRLGQRNRCFDEKHQRY